MSKDGKAYQPCKHCKTKLGSRARGLCWGCSLQPAVRALYPAADGHYGADPARTVGTGKLPKEPTDALPGTEAKILVMQERASRGEQIFHPLDAKFDTGNPD